MTNFKTALAGLRASVRHYFSSTSGAVAPVSVSSFEATPELVGREEAGTARVRRASPNSPHIRCSQPTRKGTPCGKWALLIDPITYASGCRWHCAEVELQAWHANRGVPELV